MGLFSTFLFERAAAIVKNAKRSNRAGLVAGLLRRLGSFTGW